MNGRGAYLADTNAFIYLLQEKAAIKPLLDNQWAFSFITEIELLGKPRILPDEIKKLRHMLSVAIKLAHTDEINEKAISLRQRYSIKTPDAIIGATAWQYDLPLITADKAFSEINELNIFLIELS